VTKPLLPMVSALLLFPSVARGQGAATIIRAGAFPNSRSWKIEGMFAWPHNLRRLVIRREFHEAHFLGLVQVGSVLILMRN